MKLISIRKMKKRINVPANVKMGRICAIWLFCIALQAISIPILAQSAQITLRLKNVTVEEVLTVSKIRQNIVSYTTKTLLM